MKRIVPLAMVLGALAFGQGEQPSADELFQEVWKASQQFDNAKMEFWLREMYSRYPKDLRGSVVLLDVLETRNNLGEALKLAGELREQAETVWRYRAAVGRIYFKQERYKNSIEEFQASLLYAKSAYERGASWNLMAQAYQQAGAIDESIAAFREAKAINGLPNPFLAMSLKEKGDLEGAIAEYRAVLERDPNQVLALNNLAYLFAESGRDLDDASRYARRAVEIVPGNSYYAGTLAWVLYKQRKLSESEAEHTRALLLEGGNRDILYEHLGAVMDARAVWTEARRELRDLLKREPTGRTVARVKELLGAIREGAR